MSLQEPALIRRAIRINGIVQGVGFRPHVWRLARAHQLSGFVRNGPGGVEIEVQGPAGAVERFASEVQQQRPPRARISSFAAEPIPLAPGDGFEIVHTDADGAVVTSVPLESATCPECVAEVRDPDNRRHGYAFTNCTNCGPRYTIIEALPYDRQQTTMGRFEMCPACLAEYRDPADRRFHAQPNACPSCGPQLRLYDAGGALQEAVDPIDVVAAALARGAIAAIKGLGGFHLACDARDDDAVQRLRARKEREAKPLAIMVADLDAAGAVGAVDAAAAALLTGPESPIVLLPKRAPDALAPAVAPGCAEHGVMLAYTPLHHLLLTALERRGVHAPALVMTSANMGGDPIICDDAEARDRLVGVAALLLCHDRPIAHRVDDSLVRPTASGPLFLRSSRGYAPMEVALPRTARPLLAVGAALKCTVAVATGRRAVVSPHIGDLETLATAEFFEETIASLCALADIQPERVVCDLHPDLVSSRWAHDRSRLPVQPVQHHRAHVAAVQAEQGMWAPTIGVAFDGVGLGDDRTIWGAEFFTGDPARLQRAAHLDPVPQPGGDLAAREPWRMALSYLQHTFGEQAPARAPRLFETLEPDVTEVVLGQVQRGVAAPMASSMGRLFDAVAALVCGCQANRYEAESAMRLEAAVERGEAGAYPMPLLEGAPVRVDVRPLFEALTADLLARVAPGRMAARFHNGVAEMILATCSRLRDQTGLDLVTLAGGTFANAALCALVVPGLQRLGFRPCLARRLPPGDAGLSLGQIAIAAATSATEEV